MQSHPSGNEDSKEPESKKDSISSADSGLSPSSPLPIEEKKADKEEKKESGLLDESDLPPPPPPEEAIPASLEKACRMVGFVIREFYEAQQNFHAAMPREISDTSEVKTPLDSLDQKMQRALENEWKNDLIRIHYANFLLDYDGLYSNPFANGLRIKIKKNPGDAVIDEPDSYSIDNLILQLKAMHEQFLSPAFAATCEAMASSAPAGDWAALFVKNSITVKEGSNDPVEQERIKLKQLIEQDIPKPYQYLTRYTLLLGTIKKETEELIKKAEANNIDASGLKTALIQLNKDGEEINKKYIDPLQKNVDVLKIARIVAYQLIEDSSLERNSSKRAAMLQAAEKLRILSSGSKYENILTVLNTLKGTNIQKYRNVIITYVQEYRKEIFKALDKDIDAVKKAASGAKDEKADKVMSTLINYMQALETEWEIESNIGKYTGKKAQQNSDKIKIARFSRDSLEKLKREKPLSLEHVTHIIQYFQVGLAKIDPSPASSVLGAQLYGSVAEYAVAVKPELASQKLNLKQLVEYLAKDKTKIANQLFELKTPGDRRLGQLIAAQSDHLEQADIEALSAYIALKNGKNPHLSAQEKERIYQEIKNIRDKLNQASNKLAIQQINEIKSEISRAAAAESSYENAQLLDKLTKILDTFEANISLIVVDDLPPIDSSSTLQEIKKRVVEAREALPLPPPLSLSDPEDIALPPPPLDFKDEAPVLPPLSPPPLEAKNAALLARLELRQALLEKREVRPIETKGLSSIDDEKLKSSYALMSPSVIKKIDQDFIKLVEIQIGYLEVLESKYKNDKEFQKKLKNKRDAIHGEFEKRKNNSDAKDIESIELLLKVAPVLSPEDKKMEEKSVHAPEKPKVTEDHTEREKEVALAMLELRQCLIEQRMVNPSLLIADEDIQKDESLHPQTRKNYKELIEEYGKLRRENFDLTDYSKKIGQYRIVGQKGIKEPVDAKAQKELVLKILGGEIRGEEGYRILHPGIKDFKKEMAEDKPAPTTARMLYLQYLQGALDTHPEEDRSSQLMKMKELLGKRGIELYHAAIKEEMEDPAFINAVFLKSVENFKGPKWVKKLVLWIGGPSSSGKTYATKGMIERIAQSTIMPKKGEGDNYVVTIDGAIQREVSQIRKLTIDTAIELGYRGIKDVDKEPKSKKKGLMSKLKKNKDSGKLKGRIEEAVMTNDDIHVAIPDTFTKYFKRPEKAFTKLFSKNASKDNILQVYSHVKSREGDDPEQTFERSVGRMGEARAFLKVGKKHYSITIDGKTIIESKKYSRGIGGKNFKGGKWLAQKGKEVYRKIQAAFGKETYDFDVIHDLIYIKFNKQQKKWVECTSDDEGDMRRTTRRAFDAWEKYQAKHPELLEAGDPYKELDGWLKGEGNKPTLQDPIIEFYRNGIKRDYDTENLLIELQRLQEKASVLLKEKKLESGELTKDKEFEKIQEYYFKISAFIKIINDSAAANDPINAWRDHQKGYDLVLMFKGGEVDKLTEGAIQFNCLDNGLQLRFLDLNKQEVMKTIPWSQLKGFPQTNEEILTKKNELLPRLLIITSKAGLTQQKDIDSVKGALSLLIDEKFKMKMREIENWLNIEKLEHKLPSPSEPVDLVRLGIYMADLLSKHISTGLDAEKKEQLRSIMTDLQSGVVNAKDQSLYINICIARLHGLDIKNMDIDQFNRIHLGYAAAKKRDALDDILSRKKIGIVTDDPGNIELKAATNLTSYLQALEQAWKVEAIVGNNYTKEQKEYNAARLALLAEAISHLKQSKTPEDMQATCQTLKKRLDSLENGDLDLLGSTREVTDSLQTISTHFLAQVKAQVDTRKSCEEVIKIMDSKIPEDKSADKYLADNIVQYLDTLKKEWEITDSLKGLTREEKDYNKSRLKALEDAVKVLRTGDNITLQKIQATLNELRKIREMVYMLPDPEDAALLRQTREAVKQVITLERSCIAYRYKAWLEKPLIEPEAKMGLSDLNRYILYLIEKDPTIQDPLKKDIQTKLREKKYSENDEGDQQFIHQTLSRLKDHEEFNELLIKHAQAIRRDVRDKIVKESPKEIIKKPDIEIDKQDTYNKYVANRMAEYLKAIKAEWVAQELVIGAPTGEGSYSESRKEALTDAINKFTDEKQVPSLSSIQITLRELETRLQKISSQPNGLARIPYVFASRSKNGKKSAALIAQTEEDVRSIKEVEDAYITPFKKALEEDKESEDKIKQTETRRVFLKGKEGKGEIKGTATILKLFISEVTQQQPLWVAKQLRKDKLIAEAVKYEKKDAKEDKFIDLPGWEPQEQKKLEGLSQNQTPSLDAKTICRGLPSGMYVDYKLKQDNATTIRESHQDSYVQISVPEPPKDYDTMDDQKKLEIDIGIAEAMVRLWVARCGTPVPISDTSNKSRMRALIVVCEAYGLDDYQLPLFSRYNYTFMSNPAELKEDVEKLGQKIKEEKRAPITVLVDSDKMKSIEQEFKQLAERYSEDNLAKQDPPLTADEKARCTAEIEALGELIANAKKGKLSAAAANDAVMKLSKSLAEIEIPEPPRSSLRSGG